MKPLTYHQRIFTLAADYREPDTESQRIDWTVLRGTKKKTWLEERLEKVRAGK